MVDHKNLLLGQVIYYVERGYNNKYIINFGIADDWWSDKICIRKLHVKDRRLINGIPYNEFKTPTEWKKLPKDWTYNTSLYEFSYADDEDAIENPHNFNMSSPSGVLAAIEAGHLIYADSYDFSYIEAEIDKDKGWRLVRKYGYKNPNFHTLYDYNECFYTYDEAKQWIDDCEAELKRQSELSDEEWSLELIEKVVSKWVYMRYADPEVRQEKINSIINWIKSIGNVEDIEARIYMGDIQIKHWKNKRWKNIDSNLK